MQNRHYRLRRFLLSGSLVAALLLIVPALASAKPTISELRVQVPGGRALAPGHSFVNDTAIFRTDTRPACGGSGQRKTVQNPSALGILAYGSRVTRPMRPVGVSDQFGFGLFVCGIGGFFGDASKFWLYKVNHVSPQVGADQRRIRRGDKVLWYFQDTRRGSNVGNELELRAPQRVRTGERFTLRAVEYDGEGKSKPAVGVRILGSGTDALTDSAGELTTVSARRGFLPLRAVRGGDIPSERISLCVKPRLRSCPGRRGERIYGTQFADRIKGTRGADLVISGNGDDRIDVRRNQRDRVRCGRGFDRVLASRNDRVARSCNKVVRR